MTNQAILVFQKNLIAGKTKTRLAATIGNEKALSVYKQLVVLTMNALKNPGVDKCIYYSEFIPLESRLLGNKAYGNIRVFVQRGEDLGLRMLNSFSDQFKSGYSRIIIIGTDCPDLKQEYIQQAFDLLKTYDIVIGPAADGGYYLLGMSELHPELFKNVTWSTSGVYKQTVDIIFKLALTHAELPVLRDLDNEDDLNHFKRLQILT